MCNLALHEYFYFEQLIKREIQGIHISGCRYNERLKAKTESLFIINRESES